MNKTVCIGRTEDGNFYAFIKFANGRLSISGVVGPRANGDARGGSGQCNDNPQFQSYADGWDEQLAKQFFDIWGRWHLNDMRAGDSEQEEVLRQAKSEGWKYESYDNACVYLGNRNLLVHNGYQYGTRWLTEEVPADIIAFLESLPANSAGLPTAWEPK